MQNTVKRQNLGLIILLIFCVSVLIFSDFGNKKSMQVYDCRMMHIQSDFPKEIKEECKKLLNQKPLTLTSKGVNILL